MTPPHATVAVLSIGQMGLGIATLLLAHGFRVITNVSDRSAATKERAKSAGIEQLDSDVELVQQADYMLSIVPPIDAPATAQRVVDALHSPGAGREGKEKLWFLDLNAGSPDSATALAALFEGEPVVVVDGGIIGAPPRQDQQGTWSYRPGIPLSGPHQLTHAPAAGGLLAQSLNARHLGPHIGTASGLKACFAALTKGFTALALQSFTTASALGVLPVLGEYMDVYNPGAKERAEKGIVGCTGKAYRWEEEMRLIGDTFGRQGGFGARANVFREVAGVFGALADMVDGLGSEGSEGLGSAEGVVEKLGERLKSEKE
jgi:3-hydroxyisobutyrate dehydrogenase-like beta-hydroxyacid dehydrogenase